MGMKLLLSWVIALGGFTQAAHGVRGPRNHVENDYYVLHLSPTTSPQHVASLLNISHEGPLGELPGHHVFQTAHGEGDIVEASLERRQMMKAVSLHKREEESPGKDAEDEDEDEDEDAVLNGILYSEKQHARDCIASRASATWVDVKNEDELVAYISRPVKQPNWKPTFDSDISSGGKDWRPQPHILSSSHSNRGGKHVSRDKSASCDQVTQKEEQKEGSKGGKQEAASWKYGFFKRLAKLVDWFQAPSVGLKPTKHVLTRKEIVSTFNITDDAFQKQWYLHDDRDDEHSINVGEVWMRGWTGKGVTIAVVDDGVEAVNHEFRGRFSMEGSHNFVLGIGDPTPPETAWDSDDKCRHGTRSAGVAAAGINGRCGLGVAFNANVSGIRILGEPRITSVEEAEALSYKTQVNDIYSCAWGPTDDGMAMSGPTVVVQRAMHHAVTQGRGGKGSVYVFAAGNGGRNDDNCNFDGYANSIYTMTVASIKRNGHHPPYGERCAANLISAYGSGDGNYISTVDLGGGCWHEFGGTSASAPMAAGIIAMALEARPDLTWRDVQHIAVESATNDGLWHSDRQGGTRKFSHKFGFGQIKARDFVRVAERWVNVSPPSWFFSPVNRPNIDIPRGDGKGVSGFFAVSPEELYAANFHDRLEHVTLTVTIQARRRGDISIDLISPSGTRSHMATRRKNDDSADGFRDWTLASVANWGEQASGTWEVVVRDSGVKDGKPNSLWVSWSLQLYGTVWDIDHVKPLPMPGLLQGRQNMNHTAMMREKWHGMPDMEK